MSFWQKITGPETQSEWIIHLSIQQSTHFSLWIQFSRSSDGILLMLLSGGLDKTQGEISWALSVLQWSTHSAYFHIISISMTTYSLKRFIFLSLLPSCKIKLILPVLPRKKLSTNASRSNMNSTWIIPLQFILFAWLLKSP